MVIADCSCHLLQFEKQFWMSTEANDRKVVSSNYWKTLFSLYRCRHFVFTSIDKTSFDFSSTLQNAFALHIVTFLLSSHIDPHFILQVKASQPLCNHTDCLCKDRDDLNRLHDWPTFTL